MSETIFAKAGESFPSIPSTNVWVHKLAGLPPEYVVEPRLLRDGSGYVKGGKIEKLAPVSQEYISEVIGILTSEARYGDRDMGARCFFQGFAVVFGEGAEGVEVLVCLECSWVVFYSHSESNGLCQISSARENSRTFMRDWWPNTTVKPFASLTGTPQKRGAPYVR